MIYKVGMFCKHFKGETLMDKNIYRIEKLHVSGDMIDENFITYSGHGRLKDAEELVVYSNWFENGKLFAREYDDLCSQIDEEKQMLFGQKLRVEPLSEVELSIIQDPDFVSKRSLTSNSNLKTLTK